MLITVVIPASAAERCCPRCALQVRNLLHKRIRDTYMHPQFVSDVMKPLRMDELLDQVGFHLEGYCL